MNPIFPLYETVADGEPHIFNNRIYVYGSHDIKGGNRYCPADYVIYSADLNDMNSWRYEGVSFRKDQDVRNQEGEKDLYAPDAVRGNDGCYYLYYFVDGIMEISVARSQKPEGPFEYYATVEYPKGMSVEEKAEMPVPFDPSVINVDGHIYMAYGFSVDFRIDGMDLNEKNTRGGYIVELNDDMFTMKHVPKWTIPGVGHGSGTSFEGHEFLEASSLRRYNNHFYYIYSSQSQHELCYAIAEDIMGPYEYRGVLVSNAYDGRLRNNWANNHGSLLKNGDDFYIFYHRHTHGTQFSRQMCIEKIEYDGTDFRQATLTSSGTDMPGKGKYPAAIACFVSDKDPGFLTFEAEPRDTARIVTDRIVNIRESEISFRYFNDVEGLILKLNRKTTGTVDLTVLNRNREIIYTSSQPADEYTEFSFIADDAEFILNFHTDEPVELLSIEVK